MRFYEIVIMANGNYLNLKIILKITFIKCGNYISENIFRVSCFMDMYHVVTIMEEKWQIF